MSPDVELFVKACITCGRVKQPQAYSKAKRKHTIAHQFNDILVLDHIEPKKLGLAASWVLIHGVPREIISDNARGFRATFYQAVLKSLNCKYSIGFMNVDLPRKLSGPTNG